MTKTTMSPSRPEEVTVKDLVIAAGRMGCSPSVVAPPAWATKTEIDEDEINLSVLHRTEFRNGKVYVGIENLIRKIDYGTDATLWWDSYDVKGASEVKIFSVMIDDIPAVISALQAAHDVARTPSREVRRSAEVEEMLRERES
ncbi:hypothetical protein [Microbacterium sp. UFMG61]|uniref:hypothetical protein n=1 Tax=Microbacterium sp. UFMG61 TaxID=2745935 RepID=UPI00188FEDF2|nr:hypothetical protein [Microbacterium sp. UFMG61]